MIWSSRNQIDRELACFDRLLAGYIDGLLLITNHEDDGRLAERIAAATRRVVVVDEDVPQTAVPKIFVENELGGYLATRHLLEQGHRRIAHIGGPRGVMRAIERAKGWRCALSEAQVPAPAGWHILSEYEVERARADAAMLFDLFPMPTGVFAGSDAIALGVMYQARELGIAIPDNLSLVGFDAMPINELLGPPLTSIRQPIDSLGRLAAERLIAMIDGIGSPDGDTLRLPVSLVERGSVAAPREPSHRGSLTGTAKGSVAGTVSLTPL
jgi:LacI family transcriptional regulator